jgi:hypothetical protein
VKNGVFSQPDVPALAAGGDLEPQNCHAKQMQFRNKKLIPK